MLAFGVELGEFLVDLGTWAAGVGPVEPDAGGAALQLGRALQRRKRQRNAGQGAGVGGCLALGRLDFLPQMLAAALGIAEDVRMAALHLVADACKHISEREMAGFLGHLRVEYDLELEIAEL